MKEYLLSAQTNDGSEYKTDGTLRPQTPGSQKRAAVALDFMVKWWLS